MDLFNLINCFYFYLICSDHAMVDFVKPNLLGTLKEFNNRFVNPIKNGQHSNSTPRDVSVMKKRAHVLYKTLDGCVQRKDYSVLTKYLPPRYEYVIMCRLNPVQNQLYLAYLSLKSNKHLCRNSNIINLDGDELADKCDDNLGEIEGDDLPTSRNSLFIAQQILYRILIHPHALRIHETKEARKVG